MSLVPSVEKSSTITSSFSTGTASTLAIIFSMVFFSL
jgi:hypothetical protein